MNGKLPPELFADWLSSQGSELPDELIDLLRETGGGDLFESEVVFGPFGNSRLGEHFGDAQTVLRSRGMPDAWIGYHFGAQQCSAYDPVRRLFTVADARSFAVVGTFETLEDWYQDYLRPQYAKAYGLTPASSEESTRESLALYRGSHRSL